MPSRRDQLHSYQFMTRRVVAALVAQDPDPDRSPVRATAGATLAGVLVAVIALGMATAWSLRVSGPVTGWRDEPSVIVERESGARFVWYGERLHAVPNYASARLVLGETAPRTVHVPRASLAEVPRGPMLGVLEAPDSLPEAGSLTTAAWSVCSTVVDGGLRAALLIGYEPVPGTALDDQGLLVTNADGNRYVIWRGVRHLVRDGETTSPVPGWVGQEPVPVAAALLTALPAGPDLAQVTADPPAVVPAPARVDGNTVCLAVRDRIDVVSVTVGDRLPQVDGATRAPGRAADGAVLADYVLVAPGTGAVVESVPAPGAVSLVTDLGMRYPVAGPEVLAMLGYAGVVPARMPAGLVSLVPEGPALDPYLARLPATPAGS